MNNEVKNLIENAINSLTNAKQNKADRKNLITDATQYIDSAINKINNSEVIEYIENEVPYISTYYIKPIVKPNEEVIIDYYISDYYGKDHTEGYSSYIFTVTVNIEGKDSIVMKNLKAGDHSVNLGSFPELDGEEQKFSILCTDQYGRNSHELFNYFLVRNEPKIKEYIMTEEDLVKYNIKNDDDYEVFKLVSVDLSSGTTSEERQVLINNGLLEAFNNEVVPSNKYTILAVDSTGKGVPDLNYHRHMVKYADDYNSEAVKTEAVNTRIGLQQLLDDKQSEGFNKVKLLKGIYRISCAERGETIFIPSNLTLDMNGATLKLNQFTGSGCLMISLNNTFDSHVVNGIIEGDYFSHDYANSPNSSEWVNGIEIGGEAKYSSFEDMEIRDITGYGSGNGIANSRDGKLGYTHIYPKGIGKFTYGDIDRTTGQEIEGFNRTRSDYISTNGHENIGYVSVSIYLGYQGNPCGTWNLVVYFYDKDKNFIKSTDAYQYRRIEVPSNAKYMRVVILNEAYPDNLNIHYFRIPTHCAFKRVKHDNCRCVGMAQSAMNNMLVEDCEFIRSGQNAAKCAYDAEDGWDMMQDVTFRRLNFHDNPMNDFLTCAGHNFIVEDMIDGNVYIWERTRSFVLRNSNCRNINIGYRDVVRHGISRIYNNTIVGGMVNDNIARNMTVSGALGGKVYDSILNGLYGYSDSTVYNNCEIIIHSGFIAYLNFAKMNNCIIRPAEDFTDRYSLSFNDYDHASINKFNNCKFYGKSRLANHNCFSDGEFNNCYFEDTFIEANVQGNEDEVIQFNNCEINSTDSSLVYYKPHNYTVGNFTKVQFNNCNINSNTINTFAYGHSKPANGFLEINNCSVNLPNLTLFFDCWKGYLENIKDFNIKIINTDLVCEKMLHDDLVKLGDVIKIINE